MPASLSEGKDFAKKHERAAYLTAARPLLDGKNIFREKDRIVEGAKTNSEGQAYYLFLYLIHSFESAALIGLGKLPGAEGECKIELEAASFAIDMLDMIKMRTRGNLKEEEEHYLERVLGNLKLNYLTEKERQEKHSKEAGQGDKGEGSNTV